MGYNPPNAKYYECRTEVPCHRIVWDELCQLLTLPRQQSLAHAKVPSACHFFKLPSEIVLNIACLLPMESVIALGLTCQRFCETIDLEIRISQANTESRRQFLLLLERDYPEMLFCNTCHSFYNWKLVLQRGGLTLCPASGTAMGAHREQSPLAHFLDIGEYIEKPSIDLMIRHHTLGPEFGLVPLRKKCVDRGLLVSGSETILERTYTTKIVSDELLLRITALMQLDAVKNIRDKFPCLQALDRVFCSHSAYYLRRLVRCTLLHVASGDKKYANERAVIPCKQLLKCNKCSTDYRIRGRRLKNDQGPIEIEVRAYINLGGRNSLHLECNHVGMHDRVVFDVDDDRVYGVVRRRNNEALFSNEFPVDPDCEEEDYVFSAIMTPAISPICRGVDIELTDDPDSASESDS